MIFECVLAFLRRGDWCLVVQPIFYLLALFSQNLDSVILLHVDIYGCLIQISWLERKFHWWSHYPFLIHIRILWHELRLRRMKEESFLLKRLRIWHLTKIHWCLETRIIRNRRGVHRFRFMGLTMLRFGKQVLDWVNDWARWIHIALLFALLFDLSFCSYFDISWTSVCIICFLR